MTWSQPNPAPRRTLPASSPPRTTASSAAGSARAERGPRSTHDLGSTDPAQDGAGRLGQDWLGSGGWWRSLSERDPLGRSEIEAEVGVVFPGVQDLALAGAVDVVEDHDGVSGEALGERR